MVPISNHGFHIRIDRLYQNPRPPNQTVATPPTGANAANQNNTQTANTGNNGAVAPPAPPAATIEITTCINV